MPKRQPAHVTIADRAFELGAVYASRNGMGCCRRLLAYEPGEEWPGGKVETWLIGQSGARRDPVCGAWWARWAGGRVLEAEE